MRVICKNEKVKQCEYCCHSVLHEHRKTCYELCDENKKTLIFCEPVKELDK